MRPAASFRCSAGGLAGLEARAVSSGEGWLRHWLHGHEFAVFGADALLMCVSHALSWVSCLRLLAVSWCSLLGGTGTELCESRLIELLQEVAPGETLDVDVEEVRAGGLAFCSQRV